MNDLTDNEKWEQILVKCGFHLVEDIKEFASKICPPTLDNLFSIGVKGLRETINHQSLYEFLEVWIEQLVFGVDPVLSLLDGLHKAFTQGEKCE